MLGYSPRKMVKLNLPYLEIERSNDYMHSMSVKLYNCLLHLQEIEVQCVLFLIRHLHIYLVIG